MLDNLVLGIYDRDEGTCYRRRTPVCSHETIVMRTSCVQQGYRVVEYEYLQRLWRSLFEVLGIDTSTKPAVRACTKIIFMCHLVKFMKPQLQRDTLSVFPRGAQRALKGVCCASSYQSVAKGTSKV